MTPGGITRSIVVKMILRTVVVLISRIPTMMNVNRVIHEENKYK